MEISDLLRFISALVFVVGLIAACAWAARRFGLMPDGARASNSGRLAIIESLSLDAKRKLVIVRHDNKEHVLMLGETDLVIEAGLPAKLEVAPTGSVVSLAPQKTTPPHGTVGQQIERVVNFLRERRA
ncbi:MAG: flagellar biosynthetic protein FliO [Parvibaculum sp.]